MPTYFTENQMYDKYTSVNGSEWDDHDTHIVLNVVDDSPYFQLTNDCTGKMALPH